MVTTTLGRKRAIRFELCPRQLRYSFRGIKASSSLQTKLVALSNDTKYPAPMNLARKFLGLVVLFCCTISLAVPSSAQNLHLVDHLQAPVAVGEFHGHDEPEDHDEGSSTNHDAPVAPNDGGQDKSGHSHMPSSMSDLSHSPGPSLELRHHVRDESHVAADLPSLTTRGWSPPVRPPRAV